MRRLGQALVAYIKQLDGESKFLLIEGVAEELAEAISDAWDDDDTHLPKLAVASASDHRFGAHALSGRSAANLRHGDPDRPGLCLVVCEGFQLAEAQSVGRFVAIAPSDLLKTKGTMQLLASAPCGPLRPDGPIAAVRGAIVSMPAGRRPSAIAVSNYFDLLARGEDPLGSLPALGAFRDSAGVADDNRIRDNLELAADRRSDEAIRPNSDIHARAARVLARRPGADGSAIETAGQFMTMLTSGDESILELVDYSEAKEILSTATEGLPREARKAIEDYQARLRRESPDDAGSRAWETHLVDAQTLGRAADRKDAARDLLAFDLSEHEQVFLPPLRRRLRSVLRDRSISATAGSAPEVGIARAIRNLSSNPTEIKLLAPRPSHGPSSQSAARQWISLAAARHRLGPLLRRLHDSIGAQVDALLLQGAFEGLDGVDLDELFAEACPSGGGSTAVRMRVVDASGSIEVTWAPDLDDFAMLRVASKFADEPTLALELQATPDAGEVSSNAALTPSAPPAELIALAMGLQTAAADSLANGLRPERLRAWASHWQQLCNSERGFSGGPIGEAMALAGSVIGPREDRAQMVGVSAFNPLKAEWLAQYLEAASSLVDDAVASNDAEPSAMADLAFDTAVQALTAATASHLPALLRLESADRPLQPSRESRVWSVFGGSPKVLHAESQARDALSGVMLRLLRLQPEAAGHLKILAYGEGSADLALLHAIGLSGRRVEGAEIRCVEVFAVGNRPSDETLRMADEHQLKREGPVSIELRYFDTLDGISAMAGIGVRAAHLAVVTGLTGHGARLQIDTVDVDTPEAGDEALFAPRLWQRPDKDGRILLMSPAPTASGLAWLRLMQAIDDQWPVDDSTLSVAELRTGARGMVEELRAIHKVATWVATIDRYATRDSLEKALGEEIAILHQDQRLGSESPIGLVVSQSSGGPVDRAVGRSLVAAGIVEDEGPATNIGAELRKVASQGYGILALEAATSGSGINELVGHVVGFSMLATAGTPWPLPARCRVLLVSLDEHPEWFLYGKRGDLLAIAIDTEERGLHGAVIEVKARRSDRVLAGGEALDQLKKSLIATSFAAYPESGSLASRIWLNRIAEAAYAVARESRIRLKAAELDAIEQFRRGRSTLEWAGLGLVFHPEAEDRRRVHHIVIEGDRVPIAIHEVRLTEARLRHAVETDLRTLVTVEPEASPLGGGRSRRRPEIGVGRAARDDEPGDGGGGQEPERDPEPEPPPPGADSSAHSERAPEPDAPSPPEPERAAPAADTGPVPAFVAPVLGWDQYSTQPFLWRAAGPESISNGHIQIWGSSGAGKTQFVKMLLTQLAQGGRTKFGIADFKNDYGESFPASVDAEFLDLWGSPGAPYNPLALATEPEDTRAVETVVIELRDCVEEASRAFSRLGNRQRQKLYDALSRAYREARVEHRWPTMLDLNELIGDDLQHILGDLTRYRIFDDGPPLSSVVDSNIVFGLNKIPGNGQTTVLAAAFIVSVIGLTIQNQDPVANLIRYAMVVDEAHRVAGLRGIHTMLREGRSKGLAVILATQAPADLPEVVDNNSATRICFRLSDAMIAAQAARKLDPSDELLPEKIRTLATGEAFISVEGQRPQLLTMVQHHRDAARLESGGLEAPPA